MECASCGHENRDGTRFCVECGAPLALRCPSCQAEVRAAQKFCGECGTALAGTAPSAPAAAPAPSAVRKTVTVLFADLSGSTGFGERNDPEIARQVLARYHALLQEVVDAHAGTVAKFMGDGMMATWGIPEVAEDDAHRAVAAGAALQRAFEDFAADVERRHAETLSLRVGINTGEVVIGEGDADLIGDALNVAARLEKACRPGHVLVGEETWRLTRGEVAYEALGEVPVTGRAQPVSVFEVATDADAEIEEVAAPFVGREPEMERLLAVLDDARRASGARLATILGSPGVGKTRLSRELCARADAQSVELRCDRAGEATFAPVAQLLRESAGLADDADAEAARAAIGTLLAETEDDHARVVDVLAGLVGAAPARSVEETFWAVRRLVEATAAAQPLVVVIDDIQWAEPLLLDLIEHLAEWVRGAAVLLLGLARPELREVRPALAEPGRPVADVLVLDGLDASATEALAAGLLGTERLPAGLVERLPASTDGNPLFVRELVRMLVDDRVIRRREGGEWELTIDAEAVDVPPTIQSLLGARVERLPGTERQLLEHASVVGAEFSLGALRELAGDRAPVGPLLEVMRRKELVEPTGTYWGDEPVYRFHHVLIRDAAYRRLLKTTRAELHERVAEWTDRTAADLIGEHEAAIAFHYEQAYRYRAELGAVDERAEHLARRGAELLTTAAQRALGRDDLASAGALSARALALLPESDATARADLLTMGCECLLASGDGAAARPLVEEMSRVAVGDDRLAAWADCFAAQLVGLTDPDGIVAADARVAAAAETLTALDDGSGQAKAHQVRAGLLARLGRVGDCELELDLALAAARGADDRRRVTAVLGAAPDAALFGPSPVARAGGRCLDVVRLLRITTASPAVEAASNRCQAVLESLRGRFDVSRTMLASARSSLKELGLRHALAHTDLYAGMVELIAGDPHAAIPPLRAAFGGLGALGVGADAGTAAALLARALLVDGQIDEADEMATESEHLAGQNLQTAIYWRVARAEVLAARGDLAHAVTLAEQAVEIAAGTDLIIDHADACVALATLRARAGDAAGASAARADAKRLYEAKGATVPAERLDEVELPAAAPTPEPVDRRAAGPENAASSVHARVIDLLASGRDREVVGLLAPEFRYEDHRTVINMGDNDLAAAVEHLTQLRAAHYQWRPPTTIAIRGERLALTRSEFRTAAGDDSSSLVLVECDEQGRLLANTQIDDDALHDALEELDARYTTGEAAGHADLVRLVASWISVFEDGDVDRLRDLVAPEFVWVDHQRLGWGTLHVDEIVEVFRSLRGLQNAVIVTREIVAGRAILFSAANHATDGMGGDVLWSFHAVGVADDSGSTTRVEIFAEDDLDRARARLDELGGADSTDGQRREVENAVTRLVRVRRPKDQDLFATNAPDVTFEDRRSGVSLPGLQGVDELRDNQAAQDELFGPTEFEPVAVRGDHLALVSTRATSESGFELTSLMIFETDDSDRIRSMVSFDADDIDGAAAELDARYAAGEGRAHADVVRANEAWMRAMNRFDFDAMRELAAPGFTLIDRRPLGLPELDIDALVEFQREYADMQNSWLTTEIRIRDRTVLLSARNEATASDGGGVVWTFVSVCSFDTSGRTQRIELFDEDDWDAARARFEELSVGGGGRPPLENAATRADARITPLYASGTDRELAELIAPEFVFEDRRRVVNFGVSDMATSASHLAWARRDGYEVAMPQAVAIRGDRLVLSRRSSRTPSGDDRSSFGVLEIDEQGRLLALVQFDEDALDDAVAELDARYATGEGAEHADVLAAAGRANEAFLRDPDALGALCAPDFSLEDHRRLYYGTGDAEYLVTIRRASSDESVAHTVTVNRLLQVQGRALLTFQDLRREDADGAVYRWTYSLLAAFDASLRLQRLEWFDADDWPVALARLDELGAAPSTGSGRPSIENAATRASQRALDLTAADRYDEALALYHPEFERDDRRHTVSAPAITSAVQYLDSVRAILEQFDRIAVEPIAIRGERLHLSRTVFATGDGLETVFWHVAELAEDGRFARIVNFDEDDLDAAVAELDARYAAGEGAEHADALAVITMGYALISAGEYELMRAGLHESAVPDFVFVDHRHVGWGPLNVDGFVEMQQSYDDVMRSFVIQQVRFGDRAVLATVLNRGVDPDGTEVEWVFHAVNAWNADELVTSIEMWDEGDGAAALVRFEQLAAGSDPRTLEIENAATRVARKGARLWAEGSVDELLALHHPTLVPESRRRLVGAPDGTSPRSWAQALRLMAEQFTSFEVEPIAVRGQRLDVHRILMSDNAGNEVGMLTVAEVDESDRVVRMVHFDDEDLAIAIEELDGWYVASGEASETEIDALAGINAMNRRDWDAVTALFSPDLMAIDHSPFGFAPAGREGFVREQMQGLDAIVPDVVRYIVKMHSAPNVLLMVTRASGNTVEGNHYEWTPVMVGHRGADRLIDRIEAFTIEDWARALARFDELAAESVTDARTPEVVNASTRALTWLWSVAREQRFDEVRALLADDVERIDRRKGISGAPTQGVDEYLGVLHAAFDRSEVEEVVVTPLAVRGERLSLCRVVARALDFEIVLVMLAELDDDGRVSFLASYDEDDFDAAHDELDARYIAGEGAPHARVLTVVRSLFEAVRDDDAETMGRIVAPDLVTVDHQRIGFGTADVDEFLTRQLTDREVMRRDRDYSRQGFVSGDAVLVVYESQRLDPQGGEALYQYHCVMHVDALNRVDRIEWFDLDDWDAALARLDELAAAERHRTGSAPTLENAAARLLAEGFRLAHAGDPDAMLALVGPRFVASDRRSVVAGPTTTGEDFVAGAFDVLAVFDQAVIDEIVACRGDRLALARTRFVREGFDVESLILFEADEQGRPVALVMFDEDDLDAALQELEDRYCAGEGANDAYVIRRLGDGVRARARHDWEALTGIFAPALVVTDHRLLSPGATDRDGFVRMQRELVELVPDLTLEYRTMEIRGDIGISAVAMRGNPADGSPVAWSFWYVFRFAADQLDLAELFDDDDWVDARARFEELAAADPRTPAVDNACVRADQRHDWLLRHDTVERSMDLYAPDLVQVDRRRGSLQPDLVGRDKRLEVIIGLLDVFGTDNIHDEPVAVRGDRLALYQWSVVSKTGSGFEVAGYDLRELDDDGRIWRIVSFDDDNLLSALEELEQRHRELSGEGYTRGERVLAATTLAASRGDYATVAATHADGYETFDHSPIAVINNLDSSGLVETHRDFAAQLPDRVLFAGRVYSSDRAALAYLPIRGTTEDGGGYEWLLVTVKLLDDAGLVVADHTFQVEQWGEALALFDDWSREPPLIPQPADPQTPTVDNQCVRVHERLVWLLAQPDDASITAGVDLLAPGIVQIDRRPGVAAPDMVGRDARLENLAAVAATFGEIDVAPLAVRGDRLALMRWTITADGGFLVTGYDVNELDDDGRICAVTTFDEDQLGEAVDLLEARHAELAGAGYLPIHRHGAESRLSNRATRGQDSYVAAFAALDWEAMADSYTDGVVSDDRRSGVSSGLTVGRDELLALVRGLVGVGFTEVSIEPIAVRGDELALVRRTWRRSDGFDLPVLAVVEYDTDERMTQNVMFDIEDTAAAVYELDQRYLAGAGAEHEWTVRPGAEAWRCYNARDWDGFRRYLADEVELVDHRLAGAGTSIRTADQLVEYTQGMVDLVPNLTAFDAEYLAIGHQYALNLHVALGTSTEGAEVALENVVVSCMRDGRVTRTETFDPDQRAAAMARFEQLEAEEPGA